MLDIIGFFAPVAIIIAVAIFLLMGGNFADLIGIITTFLW